VRDERQLQRADHAVMASIVGDHEPMSGIGIDLPERVEVADIERTGGALPVLPERVLGVQLDDAWQLIDRRISELERAHPVDGIGVEGQT
jgi:hypothetical protein